MYAKCNAAYAGSGVSEAYASSAGAGGHYYRYSSAHQAAASNGGMRFSNGLVGAVVVVPLALLGFWLQQKADKPIHTEEMRIRPYGFLHPPVNPYLREDLQPRTMRRAWFGKNILPLSGDGDHRGSAPPRGGGKDESR